MKGEKTVKSSVPYIGFFKPNEGAEKWAGERTLKQVRNSFRHSLPLVLALRTHTRNPPFKRSS